MKRFTGHNEEWGRFVDVKINAARLLQPEIGKKKSGRVWISGVCDPYQPIEKKYKLMRRCLEILSKHNWLITMQTVSTRKTRPRITRKIHQYRSRTYDHHERREHQNDLWATYTIDQRWNWNVKETTFSRPEDLRNDITITPKSRRLGGTANRKSRLCAHWQMNYHYADWVYKKHGLEDAMTDNFFKGRKRNLPTR